MKTAKNWVGTKQGKLKVEEKLPTRGKRSDRYRVLCECGKKFAIDAAYLNAGTLSCGCLQRESARRVNTTHGDSKTSLYSRWTSLLRRSRVPRLRVSVCPEWFHWEKFKRDVGGVPPGVQLRRIDTSRPFGPGNIQLVKVAA